MDTLGNPAEPQVPEQVATGKAKRYMAAAALLTGGLTAGALFGPIGIADAQSDDSTTDDSTTDDDAKEHHGRRGHAKLEDLSAILGLSEDEVREQLGDGMSLAQIAEAQGIGTDALVDALVATVEERLAEAVSEERLDQEEADERLANVEERVEEFVERTPGERGEGSGRGFHRHGPLVGHHLRLGLGSGELEELLGLSGDDIRGGLADGQTLAEIAAGVGVSSDELLDTLVSAANERIDAAVAEERIDSDKAEEMKASVEERVTEMVNAEPGERGERGHRGFGRRGPGGGASGDDAPADGDGEVQESSDTTA